jgi:hypothetical protein
MMGLLVADAIVLADDPLGYDGLQAGADAYETAEEQRRERIDDQLYLNDAMRARYGWPLASESVVWYGNARGYGRPLGIDYAYAYSSDPLPGRRGGRLYFERYWSPPLSVFEPWPYVPGDIYGYNFPPVIRQSIGQRQGQTGPNRWESHPVYADELSAAPPAATIDAQPPVLAPRQRLPAEEQPPAKRPRRRAF